jgi:hypothetical protein
MSQQIEIELQPKFILLYIYKEIRYHIKGKKDDSKTGKIYVRTWQNHEALNKTGSTNLQSTLISKKPLSSLEKFLRHVNLSQDILKEDNQSILQNNAEIRFSHTPMQTKCKTILKSQSHL